MEVVPLVTGAPLLLVRHAIAKDRDTWVGDDRLRPLTGRGRRQAEALVELLSPYAPVRVHTSPAVRCADTVAPLASALGTSLIVEDVLFEGRGTAALSLLDPVPVPIVLCSHGDVLPELLEVLAGDLDTVPPDPPFAKGAVWVLTREAGGSVTRARYLAPPA